MNNPVISKEYALRILKSELPGLFALNFKGHYGDYIKTEVIFAENCQLFGFVVFDNRDIDDIKFDNAVGLDEDEVLLYTCDIVVKSEYEIKRVS